MNAVDIGPVSPADRRQSPFDLFLIFAGANIVATTLQTGASLVPAFGLADAMSLVMVGTVLGSALVALLARLGPRLGVPSVIAARAALGLRGASLVAILLYVTNFAWIAVNNVIAASACTQVFGGPASLGAWALGLGLLSTVIVAGGPRVVALADRLAVPLLVVVGLVITAACLRLPLSTFESRASGSLSWPRGLDIVIGYQVSWVLMFADYSRYTKSARGAGLAVFAGLAVTSAWMMPLGIVAALAAGSADPGAMMQAVGLGAWGAVLMTVATLTTNFVNIYMSALAVRSLWPQAGEQWAVWSTGVIGAFLGLFSGGWLDQYASFMVILGGLLVPIGGILVGRFFLARRQPDVAALYDRAGPFARWGGFDPAGLSAWVAGSVTYYLASGIGSTLPSLIVALMVYGIGSVVRERRESVLRGGA